MKSFGLLAIFSLLYFFGSFWSSLSGETPVIVRYEQLPVKSQQQSKSAATGTYRVMW